MAKPLKVLELVIYIRTLIKYGQIDIAEYFGDFQNRIFLYIYDVRQRSKYNLWLRVGTKRTYVVLEIIKTSPSSNQRLERDKMCTFSRGRLRPGRKCADDGTDGLRFQVGGVN